MDIGKDFFRRVRRRGTEEQKAESGDDAEKQEEEKDIIGAHDRKLTADGRKQNDDGGGNEDQDQIIGLPCDKGKDLRQGGELSGDNADPGKGDDRADEDSRTSAHKTVSRFGQSVDFQITDFPRNKQRLKDETHGADAQPPDGGKAQLITGGNHAEGGGAADDGGHQRKQDKGPGLAMSGDDKSAVVVFAVAGINADAQ